MNNILVSLSSKTRLKRKTKKTCHSTVGIRLNKGQNARMVRTRYGRGENAIGYDHASPQEDEYQEPRATLRVLLKEILHAQPLLRLVRRLHLIRGQLLISVLLSRQ